MSSRGISTSIELFDMMSGPLMDIIANMNAMTQACEQMKGHSFGFDGIDETREKLAGMQDQVEGFKEKSSDIWGNWNTTPVFDVHMGSGLDRCQLEIQSTNQLLAQLEQNQLSLSQTATQLDILPDNVKSDIDSVGDCIVTLQNQIETLVAMPLTDMGADEVNSSLEQLRVQLGQAVDLQQGLNAAMGDMDVSSATTAYNRLNQAISSTEQTLRNQLSATPMTIPIQWDTPDTLEIFNTTGVERFTQELSATNIMLEKVQGNQRKIDALSSSMDIFPKNMVRDLQSMNSRIPFWRTL